MKTLTSFGPDQSIKTSLRGLLAVAALTLVAAGCQTSSAQYSSLSELQAAANRGDAGAQYELGMAYYHGRGVTQNYDEAKKWFDRAAATYRNQ